MTTNFARLALAAAISAAAAGSALAADWNNGAGSLKDRGGSVAVPVPAPAPLPIYESKWYFRADFGISTGSDAGFSEDGMLFGMYDSPGTTGPTPFGNNSSWFDPKFDTFLTWGGGVGYKWSDRFRTDVTIEGRSAAKGRIEGETLYDLYEYTCNGCYGVVDANGNGVADRRVRVQTEDTTELRGGFMMFNAYWDFDRMRGFTPYVGAGLGVAFNQLKRNHSTVEESCDNDPAVGPACQTFTAHNAYSASKTDHTMTLAAALMAGVAYDVNEYTTLDVNYRFLHLGGASNTMDIVVPSPDGTTSRTLSSKVSFGDTQEHQVRAGLRFNIH